MTDICILYPPEKCYPIISAGTDLMLKYDDFENSSIKDIHKLIRIYYYVYEYR